MSFVDHLPPRLALYWRLTRLDKPVGTLLLLWPTLSALWIATAGRPAWWQVAIFTLGTLLMRSAGVAINDYADRNFDPHVARTRDRPLAAGRVSPKEAWILSAALALIAFVLILPLGRLVILLSFCALFLAVTYPFTKRFLALPQAYLGVAFGFGIPMAYAAQTKALPAISWWLLLANIFWTIAYDTEYAMVDREDDRRIGIRTAAILFGRYDVLAVMACYALFIASLVAIGVWMRFGPAYYSGVAIAALIAASHYRLIRDRTRDGCFRAFLQNTWIGAAVFAGIVADRLPWKAISRALTP